MTIRMLLRAAPSPNLNSTNERSYDWVAIVSVALAGPPWVRPRMMSITLRV
jgi:hypothetical protein